MNTLLLRTACLALCVCAFQTVPAANVALTGTAFQNSTGFDGVASRGNDGIRDGNYFANYYTGFTYNGSVTHTLGNADDDYWQVDLGSTKFIDSLNVWNRTDCCPGRMGNLRVSVLDSAQVEVWGTNILTNDPLDLFRSFSVPFSTQGRFVRVQSLPGLDADNQNFVHLAEVEVYGNATAPNVARNPSAVASASSVYEGAPLVPNFAIDGSTDAYYNHRGSGNMFHSADSAIGPGIYRADAFWQVALGGDYAINEIDLFPRSDCCANRQSNFRVSVLNDGIEVWGQDYFTGGTAFLPSNDVFANQTGHLDLTGLNVTGDVVKVQQIGFNNEGNSPGGSSLMLGEVQVFGNAVPEPTTVSLAFLAGTAILLRRRR